MSSTPGVEIVVDVLYIGRNFKLEPAPKQFAFLGMHSLSLLLTRLSENGFSDHQPGEETLLLRACPP